MVPPLYGRLVPPVQLALFVLASLGTSGLVSKGRLRLRLFLPAVALLGLGTLLLWQPLMTIWRFSHCSKVGRSLDNRFFLIRLITWKENASLRQGPDFERGRASTAAAAAWNRRPVVLPSSPPLSVLLVTIESLRYDMVGYSGRAAPGATPTLDALAERAQRFHHAYANGAWTSLSIPSLMWSRNPKDLNLVKLYEDRDLHLFFEDEIPAGVSIARVYYSPRGERHASLAALLREAGFKTAAVPNDGRTHYFDPRLQFTSGFEKVYYPRERLQKAVKHPVSDVPDAAALDLAIAVLRKYRADRFFVWVHLFDSHMPHVSRSGATKIDGFRGEIREEDSYLGTLLATLTELGRSKDTIVAVMGDHGESFRYDPYGMHGLDVLDDSSRVALLIAIPGVPARDLRIDTSLIDVAPTLLVLSDVPIPSSMQGQSLVPWIAHPTLAEEHLPVMMEVRRQLLGEDTPTHHLIGAVANDHKVEYDLNKGLSTCYDLEHDPGENRPVLLPLTDNLSCRRLASYLQGWLTGP
jgi:arylsulfatase A-like enzyme